MNQLLFKITVLTLLVLLATLVQSHLSLAQGGKAEPLRVEFKRSTNHTMIGGVVRGAEQAEYVFSAKMGQKVIIKLTSVPPRSSVFNIQGPDNLDMGLEYDANYSYVGTLPKSGDYLIIVSRPTQGSGTSRYKLSISIR